MRGLEESVLNSPPFLENAVSDVDTLTEIEDAVLVGDETHWDEPKKRSHYIKRDAHDWYPGKPEHPAWEIPRHCDGAPRG